MFQEDMSAYYDDQQKKTYREVLAVGWLDVNHPFYRKISDEVLLNKLKSLLPKSSIKRTRGLFYCPFCNKRATIDINGKLHNLGDSEIWIPINGKYIFVAPDMILHYIEIHHYFPQKFIEAIISFDLKDDWDSDLLYVAVASKYHAEPDLFIRAAICVYRIHKLREDVVNNVYADNFYNDVVNFNLLTKINTYKSIFINA